MQTIQRNLTFQMDPKTENKRIQSDYYVEGYATTFDKYHLTKEIDEQFERTAFDETDLSDVILQFDHEGYVFARTSNNSLGLEVDDHGLFIYADLGLTSRSRQLYEDIASGNVNAMSIRCKAEQKFDFATDTNIVKRVKKIYDVSAVSIPANDGTEIVARCKKQKKSMNDKDKLKLKLKIGGV